MPDQFKPTSKQRKEIDAATNEMLATLFRCGDSEVLEGAFVNFVANVMIKQLDARTALASLVRSVEDCIASYEAAVGDGNAGHAD
jgi:uncharacterized membrane protein